MTFFTLVCETQSPSRNSSRRAIPRHAPDEGRDLEEEEEEEEEAEDDDDEEKEEEDDEGEDAEA